jgi:hypothetical protein
LAIQEILNLDFCKFPAIVEKIPTEIPSKQVLTLEINSIFDDNCFKMLPYFLNDFQRAVLKILPLFVIHEDLKRQIAQNPKGHLAVFGLTSSLLCHIDYPRGQKLNGVSVQPDFNAKQIFLLYFSEKDSIK